jgi:hypothetical protein
MEGFMTVKVGDWVRFARNGKLRIGEVIYGPYKNDRYPYKEFVVTSAGFVDVIHIYEVRSDNDKEVR